MVHFSLAEQNELESTLSMDKQFAVDFQKKEDFQLNVECISIHIEFIQNAYIKQDVINNNQK